MSAPLRDLAPAPGRHGPPQADDLDVLPHPPASGTPDPVVQSTAPSANAPALSLGFDGLGVGFSGPQGTFSVDSAPPDPNGAAGLTQFVEIVNESFAVFNKSGTAIYGPVPTNTLWSGFGGGCQSNNDGDATVEYDKLANRWIISQFSVSTTPYLQCVAVSATGDATGSYYRYSFQYSNFPDYPKLGVWPDAYYESFNMFNGTTNAFLGPEMCAYDRAKMLAGQAATQRCYTLSSSYGGLLPSDVDGTTPPPAGSPNFILGFGTNSLLEWKFHIDWTTPSSSTFTGPTTIPVASFSPNFILGFGTNSLLEWKFHIDWTTPANSTFTGPTTIPVASFSPACGGGTCIPQSGTTQQLDSLADRLMYRLAYRNFGDHESLVVDHSVTAGSSVGVRWYELRNPNGTPTVYQQGTYAPDSSDRWMGSIAMDHVGDIALGFSVSSSGMHPGIHYTGRLAGDALNTMTQGEGTIINGGGSQNGTLSRWGDYTSMSVDPADDCTFWYTNEYLASNGSFNWHTRVATFKYPNCTTGPSDFSISASPATLSVGQGGSGTSTISTAVTSGAGQSVSLSASGLPAGATASFNPASITSGGSSTMTVNVGSTTPAGTYTITVTGTGASATHTTSVTLTVTPPQPNDFSIGASPSSMSVGQGGSGSSTISTAVTSGSAQTVNLSASGQPAGTTVSFNPASVTAGGSSTMTVAVGSTVAAGTYTITVTGTGTAATHATSVSLTVTTSDFSIAAGPASLSIAQGASGTSTISTAVTAGAAQAISLSASGVPSGTTVSFNPASVNAGGSSTMTINVGSATATGTYTITVTGTGASATHSTSVTLAVTASVTGTGVANGGFETGNLSGWTTSGQYKPVISTTPHTGKYSAQLGSKNPVNGDSTLTQTVTLPSGNSRVTFWYQAHCTDSVAYDQIQMQVRSTSGATLSSGLYDCPASTAWTSVSVDTSAYAGQNVVLWFDDHDDGYVGDPTYFLLDDVSVSSYTPTTGNVVQNPGFETGSLSAWSASGAFTPLVSRTAHSGSYSAQVGSSSALNGDSTLTQTVTVPSGSPTLTYWYQPHCTDSITYDQIQMQVRSTSGATLASVMNVCSNSGAWTQVNFNMSAYAGQTVVLWFNDHDDGYAGDPTYFLLDDVSLS